MFGNHFYHQRIRKAVAVFGSLFNDINVIRKNSSNEVISQVKVPLSYAPKRDFLNRLDAMENGEQGERTIAVKLPRMSFEIVSMNYDATRQLPKMNNCTRPGDTYGSAAKIYSPVPYIVQFQLHVYARSQDDALQVVEQILPYFTPHYTLTVKPLDDFTTVKEDSQITMQGITFSDDYEAALEARRTIIYTLDFDMKIHLFKDIADNSAIITQYEIDVMDLDGNEFITLQDSANQASPLSGTTNTNTLYTEDNFSVVNVPRSTHNIVVGSQPTNGTVTATYGGTLTSVNGVVVANADWTYQSDPGFSGVDTFTLDLLYGDSDDFDSLSYTITMTVLL